MALSSYALSGNAEWVTRYRTMASDDERRLTGIELLATHLDAPVAKQARTLRSQIDEWRQLNDESIARGGSRSQFTTALQAEDSAYESAMHAISSLSSELATEASALNGRLRSFERLSIVSNAALVLAALVAVGAVSVLTLRERRLTETLRRRVSEELALRQAAEVLAGADTVDDAKQRITEAALEAVAGHGAFLSHIEGGRGAPANVVVRAVAGTGVPALGTASALAGSDTERAMTVGEPVLLAALPSATPSNAGTAPPGAGVSTIIVPLGGGETPIGALFVVNSALSPFRSGNVERARIFGHLAALTYEKARLLEEANERRRRLERVIHSRSRLMRGFSHDVKNPIGAADGFADLLSLGVYGELTTAQQESIDRIRRNIHRALALIDDLTDLSRAETGNVVLAMQSVNLATLVQDLCEEYQAAIRARGLSLAVELEDGGPTVTTDQARVRQIVANLLSNAIKYTEHGSITVRTLHQPAGPLDGPRVWAIVEVVDSGIGVPEDKQDFIFEEFSRLRAGDIAGAGLGLAVSKLLAEKLGGRISVGSELGRGSTFALWLPLDTAESS